MRDGLGRGVLEGAADIAGGAVGEIGARHAAGGGHAGTRNGPQAGRGTGGEEGKRGEGREERGTKEEKEGQLHENGGDRRKIG